MDQGYKTEKETFVVNSEAPSSPLEILSLALLNQWSFILLHVILSIFPLVYESRSFDRLFIESIVLCVPVIVGLTIFSSFPILFPVIILISAISLLVTYRRLITSCQWTEVLLIPKSQVKPTRVASMDGAYRCLLITTAVSILAVDFPSFPRSFCKTTEFGFSFMDMGVGTFIMMNGMISPEARTPNHNGNYLLKKSIYSCIPIMILGFQRLLLVRSINYQEIVTEYGTHWNFFFTLAFVKLISTIAHNRTSRHISPRNAAAVIIVVYQLVLSLGLKDLILSSDRSNILLANKEGIFTLPAYVSLYLVSVSMGSNMHSNRRSGKAVDYVVIVIECAFAFAVTGVLCTLTNSYVGEVSRRQANISFILWIICFCNFSLMVESLVLLVIEFLQATGFLRFQLNSRPVLPSLLCQHSLFVFLLANLMTGIVNLSMNTMQSSAVTTFVVLVVYTSLLSMAAHVLSIKKIRFKLPESLLSELTDKLSRRGQK